MIAEKPDDDLLAAQRRDQGEITPSRQRDLVAGAEHPVLPAWVIYAVPATTRNRRQLAGTR
jgi:hypothetical protein